VAVPEPPRHGVPDVPDHGLSGLVFTAGYLLSEFDLQITFFGREDLRRARYLPGHFGGRHMIYELIIDHGWLHIKAQGMDAPKLELLCSVVDNSEGWKQVRLIVGGLEKAEVRDISKAARPILRRVRTQCARDWLRDCGWTGRRHLWPSRAFDRHWLFTFPARWRTADLGFRAALIAAVASEGIEQKEVRNVDLINIPHPPQPAKEPSAQSGEGGKISPAAKHCPLLKSTNSKPHHLLNATYRRELYAAPHGDSGPIVS
jgi:hypothetical protein